MNLIVNGSEVEIVSPPLTPLLHVLRDELDITGPKAGCQQGGCGTCTVLIDGEPRRSCLTAVAAVDGASITTIEGVGQAEELSAVQAAFYKHYAAQCGFCTPGMVLAATALIERKGGPVERDDVLEALGGHYCRCTGYVKIIDAVMAASRGEVDSVDDLPVPEPGQPEVADRLGWLNISEQMREHVDELHAFVAECLSDGLTDVVLLGMGGSSLGPEVIGRTFGDIEGAMRLHVLDSTDPEAVLHVQRSIGLTTTLFVISSKSGGTIETLSHFKHFHAQVSDAIGEAQAGSRFVTITDPGSPLLDLAAEHGFRHVFENNPDIGGRYSVLSYFGLVPAVCMGVAVEALLHRCQVAEQNCMSYDKAGSNFGLWTGIVIGSLARQGRDKLTFVVAEPIASFGLWVEQLVAESLGKQGRGVVPVVDEPLQGPESYADDRVFVYLRNADEPDEELDGNMRALANADHPTITLSVHGAADLGSIFFFAEFATAVAGWVLEVNPFDQPDVQLAKDHTNEVLAKYESDGHLPEVIEADDDALRALLGSARPPHYVAILAYLEPSERLDEAVGELREAIREHTGCAVTFGYGPRFQHSTGQLHKGGPPSGVFLQLVHDGTEDLAIPGEQYTFGVLEHAAATGDLYALREHDLPAERVRLEGDALQALRGLTARLSALLH